MHNWRILDEAFLYDGTFLGFISVVYNIIVNKHFPREIKFENEYMDNIFNDSVFITTNEENSNKVLYKLKSNNYTYYNVYTSFMSSSETKEMDILKYILKFIKYGDKINFMKNDSVIINIDKMCKQVKREAHRLKGFIRFKELNNGVLFVDISPENNIIEILVNHFKERLKNESWIIIDTRRKNAVIYDKGKYELINFVDNYENDLSKEEELFQNLWKNYFKTIAIKERKNKRCQMNFMPKKYWKYLVEDVYDKTD